MRWNTPAFNAKKKLPIKAKNWPIYQRSKVKPEPRILEVRNPQNPNQEISGFCDP